MTDPIVEQVREVRDDYSSRFHHDLDAIFADVKQQEARSPGEFKSYPARRPEAIASAGDRVSEKGRLSTP